MLGYHETDRCVFDLWSPVDEKGLPPHPINDEVYPEWDQIHPISGCAVENRAFSPYAKHTQEVEDVINEIVARYRSGNYSFTLDLDDDFSQEDVEYIQREVEKRIG